MAAASSAAAAGDSDGGNNGNGGVIPTDWDLYDCIGSPVCDSGLIPCKTPLSSYFDIPRTERFLPIDVMDKVNEQGGALTMVCDLTNTRRYYAASEFAPITHMKITLVGQEVPSEIQVQRFLKVVTDVKQVNPSALVLVHCTHGVNRTGYVICRYLMSVMNMSANDAMAAFAFHRGYAIERQQFVDHLLRLDNMSTVSKRDISTMSFNSNSESKGRYMEGSIEKQRSIDQKHYSSFERKYPSTDYKRESSRRVYKRRDNLRDSRNYEERNHQVRTQQVDYGTRRYDRGDYYAQSRDYDDYMPTFNRRSCDDYNDSRDNINRHRNEYDYNETPQCQPPYMQRSSHADRYSYTPSRMYSYDCNYSSRGRTYDSYDNYSSRGRTNDSCYDPRYPDVDVQDSNMPNRQDKSHYGRKYSNLRNPHDNHSYNHQYSVANDKNMLHQPHFQRDYYSNETPRQCRTGQDSRYSDVQYRNTIVKDVNDNQYGQYNRGGGRDRIICYDDLK